MRAGGGVPAPNDGRRWVVVVIVAGAQGLRYKAPAHYRLSMKGPEANPVTGLMPAEVRL